MRRCSRSDRDEEHYPPNSLYLLICAIFCHLRETGRKDCIKHSQQSRPIKGQFTVLCSVTRPLNKSEAGVDLALRQTSLLFLRKSCCCNANEFLIYIRKAARFVSKSGLRQALFFSKAW